MKVKKNKGFFSISAVAKMFSVHQQTIRLYEKEGLISPKRSSGNTRLFSEEDIDRLEQVIYLTHQLGINLAGVQMILKLRKKIDKMQKEMNRAFDTAKEQLREETEQSTLIMKESARKLIQMKTQNQSEEFESDHEKEVLEVDNWDIEYDHEV